MPRTPIWKAIVQTLETEIASGHYGSGDKLPTEAALAARFGVNRHTVRRALGDMAERGIVAARRGSGVFVAQHPTEYPISKRVRFHQNIKASGQFPEKRVLRLETRSADPREAQALQIATATPVHVYEGLSLAEGKPIAWFQSLFPAGRFADLPDILREVSSVTKALAQVGVADYTRAETRLTAVAATGPQAAHLQLREGAPLLRATAVNVDANGHPVEFGITYFASDRITLTVTPD